eukprot:gene2195-8505_t
MPRPAATPLRSEHGIAIEPLHEADAGHALSLMQLGQSSLLPSSHEPAELTLPLRTHRPPRLAPRRVAEHCALRQLAPCSRHRQPAQRVRGASRAHGMRRAPAWATLRRRLARREHGRAATRTRGSACGPLDVPAPASGPGSYDPPRARAPTARRGLGLLQPPRVPR